MPLHHIRIQWSSDFCQASGKQKVKLARLAQKAKKCWFSLLRCLEKATDFCRRLSTGATPIKIGPFPPRNHMRTTLQTPKMLVWAPLGMKFLCSKAALGAEKVESPKALCELGCPACLREVSTRTPITLPSKNKIDETNQAKGQNRGLKFWTRNPSEACVHF